MRTALFWIITMRVVVISSRRFRATYQSHLQGSIMEEERTSHLLHGGSLKSHILNEYLTFVHFMHIESNVFNLLYKPNA